MNSATGGRGVYLARYAQALHDAEGPRAAIDTAAEAVVCLNGAESTRMRRELARLSDKAQPSLHTSAGKELHDLLATVV
jgi:hypothetical protein